MIGVTLFGLIFTPAFYVICRWLAGCSAKRRLRRSREQHRQSESCALYELALLRGKGW